jgi:hypothetical protein
MNCNSASTATTAACAITNAVPSIVGATHPLSKSPMLPVTHSTLSPMMVCTALRETASRVPTQATNAT